MCVFTSISSETSEIRVMQDLRDGQQQSLGISPHPLAQTVNNNKQTINMTRFCDITHGLILLCD